MVAKTKFLSLIITFLILLMDFSAIGFIAINDGEILSELAGLRPPKLYMNVFNPLFKNFRNGTPITIWEDKIIEKIVISPVGGSSLDLGKGLTLGSSVDKTWKTGINATGELSKGLKKVFEGSVRNINGTGVLVLAFFATDIAFLNETLFSDERIRIVTDEVLRFAEEVGDASIILSGNYCTATNLIYLLKRSEETPKIREVYLIVLTHGILNETLQVHGMLMHGENGTAVVNGETLEHLATLYNLEKLRKLKFVYLPFCNMGREKEIYNEKSIVTFFEKHSEAMILTYDGEAYLNGDYIASLQTILSSGTYELIEEATYIPIQVIDNLTGETLDAYIEFRVEDEIEEVNSTINPYKIYDDNINITLGFKPRRISKFNGKYKATIHSKKVRAIICRGKPPKNRLNKRVIHIRHKAPPTCKKFGKKHNLNFKHKTRNIAPVITGRFWKPPEIRKQQHINKNNYIDSFLTKADEVKRAIFLVDEIFAQIYSNYYSIKSAIYKWIDKTFNAPWNKWMRGPIKSTLDNSVFRGTSFIINFAKNHLKTIVCIAVNLKNTNKNLGELVAAIIIAAIAKNARGILKYFSWTMDKLLETLSKILSTDLDWVKKILNGWTDPNIKFLDNVVAYSEATFKSTVKKLAETIIKPFNWVWNQIKTLLNTLWSNFVDFSVDNYLTLAYLIAELAAERKISEKLAKSIINTAGKIIDFIINLQPTTQRLKSWAKIYNTWLIAGIITKRIHWTDSAGRDKTPSSIKAHGRIDQVYDILYETLGERVKHVSFIRTDDLELVVWRGRRPFWFDSRISRNLIEKTELLVENPDLASSKIIEIDKNGKITKITLAREKSGHYHRWFGEIRLIQIVHTSIEGKPTSFAIVWEGYINWFQDPTTNEEAKKLNENFIKNFKDPKYKDVLLISNFINCEVKTEDFTLKGFRIVVGVNPKFSLVKESYGTLVAKSKKDRVENKLYRFDEGILGENWETRLEKVKSLMFEQTSVWREYIKNYEASEGKRPTFFDVISQTTFDAHLTVIDGKIEGVINSADPPFLEEPPLAHTAQILILEKIEERLRNEGLNYEASKIHEKRIKIEKFLENEYKTFYNTIYKRFRKKLENINSEEELKGIEDVYQRVKRKSEIIANLKTEALEESGPVGFVALDKAKYNDLRAKAKMKVYGNKLKGIIPENEIEKICWEFISVPPPKGIEIEGLQRGDAYRHITMEAALALTSLDKNRAWQFTENKQALKDVSDKILNRRFKEIKWEELICHKNYFKKVITENKVKSKLKKLLGKTIEKACGMGTAALFIALFATTSFLGIRLGIEIYKKLPKDAKDVLNSGYGEIRVHILLSCVSFILLNIDDYQDFVNSLSRKTSEGTLKNTVKVLLQTFLGCIINGLLLAMLTEKKNNKVILADDIIPYIARTLFGNNAWIFEKIIWPIISNIIQIVANGGPIMYLAGITIGTTITQILNNIL